MLLFVNLGIFWTVVRSEKLFLTLSPLKKNKPPSGVGQERRNAKKAAKDLAGFRAPKLNERTLVPVPVNRDVTPSRVRTFSSGRLPFINAPLPLSMLPRAPLEFFRQPSLQYCSVLRFSYSP